MDSNLPNPVGEKRVVLKTWLRILLALLAGILAFYAIAMFKDWQYRRGLDQSRQMYDEWQEEFYQQALADNVGGKTPQDTLRMYIEAVEKGDYELASKYFILEKQEKELTMLKGLEKEKLDFYLSVLKDSLDSEGGYSWDKKGFVIREPVLVDFALYPSEVWKLSNF
jgi:hypothetical protein